MHAAVETGQAEHKLARPAQPMAAIAGRIEQPYFDVGVLGQPEKGQIKTLYVDIIQKQAHAHPPVGGSQQIGHQKPSGGIRPPHVIDQIKAAPCMAGR